MTTAEPAPLNATPAYPSAGRGAFLLAILVVAYIISFIDRQILALLVNPIKADLAVSDFQMSLLQGMAFAVMFSLFGLPLGRLADRLNRKRLIAFGIFLWSLSTMLCGLAGSYEMLFLARMGVGVGEAALYPAGISLLADSFRPERYVRAASIFSMGGMLGAGIAFVTGGLLIDAVTRAPVYSVAGMEFAPWQLTFLLVGLPGLLVAGLMLLIREPPRRDTNIATVVPLGQAVRYLWGRRLDYAPIYLCNTLLGVCNYAGMAWLATHLIRTFGMTAGEVGLSLGLVHIASVLIGTALGARLTERLIALGYLDAHLRTTFIVSVGLLVPLFAPLLPNAAAVLALWFVAGLLLNGYYGTQIGALMLLTPNRIRATNAALMLLVMGLAGNGLGTAAVGAIADNFFAGDPAGIGKSLTIVGVTAALLSAMIARMFWPRFRAAVANAPTG